jgi:hypothetical protein
VSVAGHLVDVKADRLGGVLTADLAVGDTVVHVDSTIYFDEIDGGSILIGGVKLDYDAFDDPEDVDADTDGPTQLTLTAPSTVAADESDPVWAYDPTTGADDPVTVHRALVTIDDRDPGDALPARIRAGIVDQLVSDFETYLGKAVELDVDEDTGELILVDIIGSKGTGGVKFMQDETIVIGSGGTTVLELTYIPIENSEHLYIGEVYQRGSEWSRDRWTVTIPDPNRNLKAGNKVAMEYAYRDPAPRPPSVYGGPTSHAIIGTWDSYPTSFLTSQALPVGTQVGDLLVVVAIGTGDRTISDPRITTLDSPDPFMAIGVGYATDLSALECRVGGTDFPLDQFAGIEILAVHGSGDPVAYDPAQITLSHIGVGQTIDTIAASGHGAIAAIVSGIAGDISIDMATDMPAYTDWLGDGHTSVLGRFGYCATNPPPTQTNPTNATTLAAVIGLK